MDNVPIDLIVGLIIAVAAAISKKSAKAKAGNPAQTMPDTTPSGQPILSEADRRYREVQEEIRRRIAQRNQTAPVQPATVTPNPMQDYQPSKKITQPIGRRLTTPKRKAAPPPPLAQPADPPPLPPMMADAPAMAAAPAYPSEAAAYALPKASDGNAASSGASPEGGNALRAILASPSAARQAYLLREIFGQPLSLRPMISGGLEDWN